MNSDNTQLLVASPCTLRSLAKGLREKGFAYTIERVAWTNFNPGWKGFRGLALRVTNETYSAL